MAKQFDPYALLPSSAAVAERLAVIQEEARKLKKLLDFTAEIEAEEKRNAEREGAADVS